MQTDDELRDLAQVVCRALLMIVSYLNKRYDLRLKAYHSPD
jgi:hypothetical protein